MKKVAYMSLCWLSCISFALGQHAHDRKYIARSFRYEISTDKTNLSPSDPIIIKLTVTNTSSEELYAPNEPLVWFVSRQDGAPVIDSEEGLLRKKQRHGPRTLDVSPLLAPGSSISQVQPISNLYMMKEPGVYLIEAVEPIGNINEPADIRSNILSVTVR